VSRLNTISSSCKFSLELVTPSAIDLTTVSEIISGSLISRSVAYMNEYTKSVGSVVVAIASSGCPLTAVLLQMMCGFSLNDFDCVIEKLSTKASRLRGPFY